VPATGHVRVTGQPLDRPTRGQFKAAGLSIHRSLTTTTLPAHMTSLVSVWCRLRIKRPIYSIIFLTAMGFGR